MRGLFFAYLLGFGRIIHITHIIHIIHIFYYCCPGKM